MYIYKYVYYHPYMLERASEKCIPVRCRVIVDRTRALHRAHLKNQVYIRYIRFRVVQSQLHDPSVRTTFFERYRITPDSYAPPTGHPTMLGPLPEGSFLTGRAIHRVFSYVSFVCTSSVLVHIIQRNITKPRYFFATL